MYNFAIQLSHCLAVAFLSSQQHPYQFNFRLAKDLLLDQNPTTRTHYSDFERTSFALYPCDGCFVEKQHIPIL
jgi:hypothetical protein